MPCIFYGDEAGIQGWEDPFCRRCFPWGQEDAALTQWYRELLKLRKSCPALGGFYYRTVSSENGVFIFERETEAQKLTVAVNLSDSACPMPAGRLILQRTRKMASSRPRVLQ